MDKLYARFYAKPMTLVDGFVCKLFRDIYLLKSTDPDRGY
jgi:hypothetical protein